MSWRWLNLADGDQCTSQVGCCQLGMQVSGPLATGAPEMQRCSQFVDKEEASATDAARRDVVTSMSPSDQTCGCILDRLDLPKKAVWHTAEQGVAIVETAANELFWQRWWSLIKQLDVTVEDGKIQLDRAQQHVMIMTTKVVVKPKRSVNPLPF